VVTAALRPRARSGVNLRLTARRDSAPAHISGDAGRVESLASTPIVVDAHDAPFSQGEDVEDLAQGLFLGADVRSPCAQHDLLAAAGELECVDLAALLEPPPEGVDHLLAAVTDPLLAQTLPADVRIEQPRRNFEIAALA
jgi:hypothetical protein